MGLYDRDYALAPEALERTRARGPRKTPRAHEPPPMAPKQVPTTARAPAQPTELSYGCLLVGLALTIGVIVWALAAR